MGELSTLFLSVFHPCSQSAPDMPFVFVQLQHLAYFLVQLGILCFQPLCDIFMYGAFADAEMAGGSSYRRIMLNHICAEFGSPFVGVINIHKHLPPAKSYEEDAYIILPQDNIFSRQYM
jgi:hypothetical protein